MANTFVRSTTGSDANDGLSWATAKATLQAGINASGSSDTVFVSKSHVETLASGTTLSLSSDYGSTTATPLRKVVCVDDAGDPASPTTQTTGAIVYCTGDTDWCRISGPYTYCYGIRFDLRAVEMYQCGAIFDTCTFRLGKAGINADGCFVPNGCTYINCNITVIGAGSSPFASWIASTTKFFGGSFAYEGAAPAYFFGGWAQTYDIVFDGVDLSALPNNINLWRAFYNEDRGGVNFINCKLPAGWSGSFNEGGWAGGSVYAVARMHNCDAGDTNYRFLVSNARCGKLFSETAIARSGGATNGTTPLSVRMVTTGRVLRGAAELPTEKIAIWNETIGTPVTATVEVLTDGVTLTDAECWLEVQYLGTSGFPLGAFASDQASLFAAPAAQTTSTATWTTTGITTPVKQKLQVTFTPQEKGFVQAVVKLAKPSTTVYVCPKLEIN